MYGDIDAPLEADETFPLKPSSPYAASKAAADLLALSYVRTFKLPVVVTRASNNYGPYQFPEKLIPLMIANAIEGMPLPVYGDGMQVRDWLYVDDHCRGILAVLERGRDGEVYNIGGNCALPNRDVIEARARRSSARPRSLMTTVTDRPGHDRRYALSSEKIARETGFVPEMTFETGLAQTVRGIGTMSIGRGACGRVSTANTTRRTTAGGRLDVRSLSSAAAHDARHVLSRAVEA